MAVPVSGHDEQHPHFASRRCNMMALALWFRVRHPVVSMLFPHPREPISRLRRLSIQLFIAFVQFHITCPCSMLVLKYHSVASALSSS